MAGIAECAGQAPGEPIISILEVSPLSWTQLDQPVPDQPGHAEAIEGVEEVMGIAAGMHISHQPGLMFRILVSFDQYLCGG